MALSACTNGIDTPVLNKEIMPGISLHILDIAKCVRPVGIFGIEHDAKFADWYNLPDPADFNEA